MRRGPAQRRALDRGTACSPAHGAAHGTARGSARCAARDPREGGGTGRLRGRICRGRREKLRGRGRVWEIGTGGGSKRGKTSEGASRFQGELRWQGRTSKRGGDVQMPSPDLSRGQEKLRCSAAPVTRRAVNTRKFKCHGVGAPHRLRDIYTGPFEQALSTPRTSPAPGRAA